MLEMRQANSTPGGRVCDTEPLDVIIIGAGFAGVGMAISLKRAGVHAFLMLEKAHDIGGVWRDNEYPGAACDVPSHLYSYSFAPNPDWSHVFAPQAEIRSYIDRCADAYGIRPHVRCGTEVAEALYDEDAGVWRVSLVDGARLTARMVVSAVGQLSRPALPRIAGLDRPTIPTFHSARWRHDVPLAGKRVAVIGTGASAIQLVPAIAPLVATITIFQRSPAHIIPRPDRAYSEREKARFASGPLYMRLQRLKTYLAYESRALAFTRFKALLDWQAGGAFRKALGREIPDPALRAKLDPDYPVGCKRVLLSNDYLPTMARSNVEVVTEAIESLTETGVRTADGQERPFDAIIYGTGFAATDFLVPMRVVGRGGVDLRQAWRDGASAYLGVSVPKFPNFFILYGPNTNLGHNSIIYMLEAQISHVLRCRARMAAIGADAVEVRERAHRMHDARTQRRLTRTVWADCRSWYTDASGRNTTNWPGFTFAYRRAALRESLDAYRFTTARGSGHTLVHAPGGRREGMMASAIRGQLRATFRRFAGPPFGPQVQRMMTNAISATMAAERGVSRSRRRVGPVDVEIVGRATTRRAAILYLHGGAFCLGNPFTHRALTSRLAAAADIPVWVPDYRLAPEHPYPAALLDALGCWHAMRESGLEASQIVLAGDSAGGALVLALALRLIDEGQALPAGLALLSPFIDASLSGETLSLMARRDPMIRPAWLKQAMRWYGGPGDGPLDRSLAGLPPMFIQAGEDETLLADAERLHRAARRGGVASTLEVHRRRWHVFQLQAGFLRSANDAISEIAAFAVARASAAGIRSPAKPHGGHGDGNAAARQYEGGIS
ncbi:alpha/beta hydrolase fold domain-containing protein [Sphingomonas zeae]|nr:alpha/beta hydrolase fold domain-containing protein [Sphingomonas zeae]MBB4049999.1 cation diffusion facilitator CzcD-associated flavoprotein CzcO/acetyl esterase/lipase [Sphingomonas zeae]